MYNTDKLKLHHTRNSLKYTQLSLETSLQVSIHHTANTPRSTVRDCKDSWVIVHYRMRWLAQVTLK
jgi:hypothetical protein